MTLRHSWIWPVLAAGLVACSQDAAQGTDPDAEASEASNNSDAPQPGADDPDARPWKLAGDWYPENPGELAAEIDGLLGAVEVEAPRPARAVVVPHASLKFSGHLQAEAFARVEVGDLVIVLASDHNLQGEPLAVWDKGPWLVPGYALQVRHDVVEELQAAIPDLKPDTLPFEGHPAEMQMPFLARLNPQAGIVVIAFHDNSRRHFDGFDPARIRALGEALAGVIARREAQGERVLIVTTTDLVHREPLADVERQDAELADLIAQGDIDGLHSYVTDNQTTICGELPTATLLATLEALGEGPLEIVARGNSEQANGDESSVIGYLSGVAWR